MKQLIIFAILMPAAVAAEMKLPAALQQAVPPGWAATHYASGDLNGDQRADAALIIQQQNPALRLKNEGLGADVLDTNPRRLLVLVRENEGYRLLVQTQTHFLPPQGAADAPCLADPLEDDAHHSPGQTVAGCGLLAQLWQLGHPPRHLSIPLSKRQYAIDWRRQPLFYT